VILNLPLNCYTSQESWRHPIKRKQPLCDKCRKPMLARERLALTGDGVTVVHRECQKGGKG